VQQMPGRHAYLDGLLVPLFPFWAVNLAPALLDVRLRSFATATLIGVIPGARWPMSRSARDWIGTSRLGQRFPWAKF
jgi:hypothetical protein